MSFLKYIGPGLLVSICYLDPGNISGDLEAGIQGEYSLLWSLLISVIIAIFYQCLAMKLGVVTGNDLAKLCRIHYSKEVKFGLWIMAEIALIGAEI